MHDNYEGKHRDDHPAAIRLGMKRDALAEIHVYVPGKHRDDSPEAYSRNLWQVASR